jgi:hypothetical protein
MGLPVSGEPFDRDDLAPLGLDAEEQAGEDRPVIDQHRAGAAFPELAAVLGARQPEVLAQHLEESLVRLGGDLSELAVDAEAEQPFFESRGHRALTPSGAFSL